MRSCDGDLPLKGGASSKGWFPCRPLAHHILVQMYMSPSWMAKVQIDEVQCGAKMHVIQLYHEHKAHFNFDTCSWQWSEAHGFLKYTFKLGMLMLDGVLCVEMGNKMCWSFFVWIIGD